MEAEKMGRIIWEVVKEEGKIITQYRCRKDGTILWEELSDGTSIKGQTAPTTSGHPWGTAATRFPWTKKYAKG